MKRPPTFSKRLPLLILFVAASCAATKHEHGHESDREDAPPGRVVARGLDGAPLRLPRIAPERRARLEADLAEAAARYAAAPTVEDNVIWYGRRLAYLGRYDEAVEVFTKGIAWNPRSSKLHRHRGHRYITLRQLQRAERDLELAAQWMTWIPDGYEPDGAPNDAGIPRSTHRSNVWYHLGLARYLQGDFAGALAAYDPCLAASEVNDDMWCATAHWRYMTLRRLGRDAEAEAMLARVGPDMDVIENHGYHHLLLLYRGLLRPEDLRDPEGDGVQSASVLYGLGNFHLVEGRPEAAREIFEEIVAGDSWAAFGYIAAEAELARDGG